MIFFSFFFLLSLNLIRCEKKTFWILNSFAVPLRKKGISRFLFPSFTNNSSNSANDRVTYFQDSTTNKSRKNDFYIGMEKMCEKEKRFFLFVFLTRFSFYCFWFWFKNFLEEKKKHINLSFWVEIELLTCIPSIGSFFMF